MALSLLLASCEEEGKPSYIPNPAVDISVLSVGIHDACVEIQSINASQTRYLCAEKDEVRRSLVLLLMVLRKSLNIIYLQLQ